jgi:hypothetical protein
MVDLKAFNYRLEHVQPRSTMTLETRQRGYAGRSLHPAVIGAALLGACGGVVGLVVGLLAYPPTAWFAVFEVGLPAAVVGSVLGLVAAVVARRLGGRRTPGVERE